MFKNLFMFIGRKKRIDCKLKYLKRLIDDLPGTGKVDFSLEVAGAVATAGCNRELEGVADFYIQKASNMLES